MNQPNQTRRRLRLGHLLSTAVLCIAFVTFATAHIAALLEEGFRLSLVLLVVFETIMVVTVFVRRAPSEVDLSPPAVAVGLLGTLLPLLLRPSLDAEEMLVGQILLLAGLAGQVGASLSIRRSFGLIPANRGVQTSGLYRYVRHPFYLSYLLAQLGYLANNPSTLNVAVLSAATGFQVTRIWFEERLLCNDAQYREYRDNVLWRLLPGVW